ncbi:MAG: MFS transporter [Chloroflexi bacterium]|nr:MFS transporter [Chloroflexota bacterium]
MGEAFASLRIRDFRFLAISTLASGFAQWAKQLAIFALVYEMTGSAVQLGTVAAFRGIVGTLLAPYGGYLSDRFSRRTLIVGVTLFDAFLAGVLATLVLADQHELWHIYVVALGGGVAQSTNQSARQAFVYDITTDETMPNAIAVNSMVQNVSRVLGPAGFGVVMAIWGIADSLIMLLVLQVLATIATLAISRTTQQVRLVAGSHALTMMREGFAYCWHDRRIFGLVVASTIPSLLVFSYLPFLKVVSEDVLDRGNTGYGLLSSMGGWGSLVGLLALASMANMRHRGWWMLGGYLAYTLLLIVFSWSANFYFSMALLVVAGIFFSISSTLNNTLLLQLSPSEMRGRVMSVNQMAHGVQPLGAFPMAFAVSAFGVQVGLGIFMIAATVAFVIFAAVWTSVRRL